jgi:hypothetical protein
MPLLNDLTIAIRRVKLLDTHPVIQLGDNVEHWLMYLSQPQSWLAERHNLENRALFLQISDYIAREIQKGEKEATNSPPPDWLKELIRRWTSSHATIISFNYDTLVERAVAHTQPDIRPDEYYPIPITRGESRFGSLVTVPPGSSTLWLTKLHGSVNWWYSGSSHAAGETIYRTEVTWGSRYDTYDQMGVRDKVPLIVPPISDKSSYFNHESIRGMWRFAANALQKATRVFIVGYSLPESDLAIRFFLRVNASTMSAQLRVVDINQVTARRISSALKDRYSIVDPIIGPDCLVKLANQRS